ncbi:hypothetical protein PVAP13_1NG203800 [Panicum virgatum]|uniref:Uncharacterized protein n=1 Tax=Panicum virgatum TaxID=38727 RepID=A0A8T0WMC3_PANVG|nr:hypothetical protein PVAP13_1NG203800 [Panicum virgatum]
MAMGTRNPSTRQVLPDKKTVLDRVLGKHNLCTAKLGTPLKSNADTPLPATHIHTLSSASTPQLAGTRASTPRPPHRRAGPPPRRPLATAARHGRWVNSPRRAAPPGHDSELLAPRTTSQRRAAGTAPHHLRPRLRARQRCCRPGAAPKPARLCSAAAGAPSSPPPPPPRRAAATTPPLEERKFQLFGVAISGAWSCCCCLLCESTAHCKGPFTFPTLLGPAFTNLVLLYFLKD